MSAVDGGRGVSVGERLAQRRQERGWTQADLAERLETSPMMVSHWELGRRTPGAGSLVRLCDVLDCSADWLLGRTD